MQLAPHEDRTSGASRGRRQTIEVSRAAQVATHNWQELASVRYDDTQRKVAVEWHEKAFDEANINFETVHDDYDKQVATAPAARGSRG